MSLPPGYTISADRSLLDLGTVHAWLKGSYWSPGVSREVVERAAAGASLVLGAYYDSRQTDGEANDVPVHDSTRSAVMGPVTRHSSLITHLQVGYLRVVSDKATFAWICDVFVHPEHRGKGIAKALVRRALEDPGHQGLRRWVLATKDAHAIYAACGFEPLPEPERWLVARPRS